ncbi:MAG: hypothetical protein LBI67_12015 [Treponema sp.]|jgi:hypothetical protein|nr:hypothetical protein [Treponema sp.]
MNMDRGTVDRALAYVGEWKLTEQDAADKNTNYEICKEFYLQTLLEALSEVPWTGGRKRAKLCPTGLPHLPSPYRFTYDVPFDCARALELRGDHYFIVEGRFIHADAEKVELLYVSNGRVLKPSAIFSAGKPGGIHDMEYITAGPPGTEPDFTIRAGRPRDLKAREPVDLPEAEDYPDYRALEYEPKFYQYVELMLAAKFAVKQSTDLNLHNLLMQEAMLIKNEAVTASGGSHAARQTPKGFWSEDYVRKEKYAHN